MSNTVSIIQKQALNMLVCTYVAMKCISLTHTAHMHVQSYRMHLKSSNGPIDVLVCPERDDQQPHSPYPSVDGCSQAVTTQLSNTTTSTPKRRHVNCLVSTHTSLPVRHILSGTRMQFPVLHWMHDLEWWHATQPTLISNLLSLSREVLEVLFITHLACCC